MNESVSCEAGRAGGGGRAAAAREWRRAWKDRRERLDRLAEWPQRVRDGSGKTARTVWYAGVVRGIKVRHVKHQTNEKGGRTSAWAPLAGPSTVWDAFCGEVDGRALTANRYGSGHGADGLGWGRVLGWGQWREGDRDSYLALRLGAKRALDRHATEG